MIRKYSTTLHGHRTSFSLEPAFHDMLKGIADGRALPLAALIREIDGNHTLGAAALAEALVMGLTPDGGHLTGGTAGPAGRMSVWRASVRSTPRSFGSRLPAW